MKDGSYYFDVPLKDIPNYVKNCNYKVVTVSRFVHAKLPYMPLNMENFTLRELAHLQGPIDRRRRK